MAIETNIEEQIKKLLVDRFDVDDDVEIFHKDRLNEDLGLNLISHIEFVDHLDKLFKISISAKEEKEIVTFGDAVRIVKAQLTSHE